MSRCGTRATRVPPRGELGPAAGGGRWLGAGGGAHTPTSETHNAKTRAAGINDMPQMS